MQMESCEMECSRAGGRLGRWGREVLPPLFSRELEGSDVVNGTIGTFPAITVVPMAAPFLLSSIAIADPSEHAQMVKAKFSGLNIKCKVGTLAY